MSRPCSSFKRELHTWHRIGHYLTIFFYGAHFSSHYYDYRLFSKSSFSTERRWRCLKKEIRRKTLLPLPLPWLLLRLDPLSREDRATYSPDKQEAGQREPSAFPLVQMCTAERTTTVPAMCWLSLHLESYSNINVIQISWALLSKNSQEELLRLPTH